MFRHFHRIEIKKASASANRFRKLSYHFYSQHQLVLTSDGAGHVFFSFLNLLIQSNFSHKYNAMFFNNVFQREGIKNECFMTSKKISTVLK